MSIDLRPDPTRPLHEQSDRVLLRICLWAEARGEQDADGTLEAVAMAGIAHVIMRRVHERQKTVAQIILAPYQFSWTMKSDPNYAVALHAPAADPIAWERADTVADLLETGLLLDPTNGANHYYNPKVSTPSWGRGHSGWIEKIVIGNHVFGRSA